MKSTVVIGGGHNGLTAACLLAQAGHKVTLVEKNNYLGGMAADIFLSDGASVSGILHDNGCYRERVIKKLNLKKYGLNYKVGRGEVFCPRVDGAGVVLGSHPSGLNGDTKNYDGYQQFIRRIRPFITHVFDSHPPQVYAANFHGLWDLMKKAVGLRRLGKADMMELLRIGPMCVADWLGEWFDSDHLKAAIAAPAVYGNFAGPWSPGTNANLVMYEALSISHIEGGSASVVAALSQAAKALGVEVRLGQTVKQIKTENECVTGVELDDGSFIAAPKVLSTLNPKKVFSELLDSSPFSLEEKMNLLRCRGTTALVALSLEERLKFHVNGEMRPEKIRLVETIDDLEKAFDPAKYGELPENPVLEIEARGSQVSIQVHFVAKGIKDSDKLVDVVLNKLHRYVEPVNIKAQKVILPEDLEDLYGNENIFHGEHAADQILTRPTPETFNYETPIGGLFLGGSGSHPGGGLTSAPGSLAAQRLLNS